MAMTDDYRPDELVEKIIGAAIEVHRHLGAGFAEATYHKAMEIELSLRQIPFASEVPIGLQYKNRALGEGRIDLLIDKRLVVELKACEANPERFRRQVVCYLKATGLPLGLVINFEVELLKQGINRVVVCENT